jgi:hypothetical protein
MFQFSRLQIPQNSKNFGAANRKIRMLRFASIEKIKIFCGCETFSFTSTEIPQKFSEFLGHQKTVGFLKALISSEVSRH